jgi:pyruvate/2-oxoglutarate dehydrogenase complex dihydrolipoamide dehydrogenase (E3) component
MPDFKADYRDYTKYMIAATKACGATIKTSIEVTPEIIKQGNFDTVIVATGAITFVPNIPGTQDNTILDPLMVLDSKQITGDTVIVCGAGLVGCEVAMFLAEQGREVTMIDMLASAAPDMNVFSKWVLESKLAEMGIKVKVNHKITEMTGKSVSSDFEGQSVKYEADSVICALGLKSSCGILEDLRASCKGVDIIPVGDVNKPRKIMQATHEGFHAARRI